MTDEPAIDAVAMTRRIRDAHAERLREATREERLAFFNRAARTAPGATPAPGATAPHARNDG